MNRKNYTFVIKLFLKGYLRWRHTLTAAKRVRKEIRVCRSGFTVLTPHPSLSHFLVPPELGRGPGDTPWYHNPIRTITIMTGLL